VFGYFIYTEKHVIRDVFLFRKKDEKKYNPFGFSAVIGGVDSNTMIHISKAID